MKKKIICTICARKGSKGLPGKNIKKIGSIPLIGISILQAKKTKLFDKIVVSTDCEKIKKISKYYGAECWFLRDKKLSGDKQGKLPVIIDLLHRAETKFNKKYDYVCDLDPTSPLRTIKDVKNAFMRFKSKDADNLITGCESQKNPYFNMVVLENRKVTLAKKNGKTYLSRQMAPKVYDMNASIYFWKRSILLKKKLFNPKTVLYEMPVERSIDIDNIIDFINVNSIIKVFKRNDIKFKK
jgi:CMP-N,N'-diacetyllegionaminic acid synthase